MEYSAFLRQVNNQNLQKIYSPRFYNKYSGNYSLNIEAWYTKKDFYFDDDEKYGIVPNKVVKANLKWYKRKTQKEEDQYFLVVKSDIIDKYLNLKN